MSDEKNLLPAKTGAMASGNPVQAIVPRNVEDVFRLAKVICVAGMAPVSMETEEKVTIAIMHGLEIGLPPMMAIQSIAVINGRPTVWGDGAMALVRATGELEELIEWVDGEGDETTAHCTVKRKGTNAITHKFSIKDAKLAGLWNKKGPWTTYPMRMLAVRPRSWCLRDVFADALKGLHFAEEVRDIQNITPQAAPKNFLEDDVQGPVIDGTTEGQTIEPVSVEVIAANLERYIAEETDGLALAEWQNDNHVTLNGLPEPHGTEIRELLRKRHAELGTV